MRILFVAHSFPRHEGDAAGSFLLSLIQGLRKRGHECMAVVPHDAGLLERDELAGVPVRRFRYGRDEQETLAYKGTMADQVMRSWSARWRILAFLRESRRAISRAVDEWRPDIVHAHWWFPGGVSAMRARRGPAPIVLTSHGTDLFLLDRVSAARTLARPVFRAAARVTVISTPLVARVAALGVDQNHISVIPMPVDASLAEASPAGRAEKPAGRLRLLFVGRLVERKGCEYAIRALALLAQRGIDATLTVIGDGPLRVDLDNLCDELVLGSAVHFMGLRTPEEVRCEMRESDLFLMPAVTDWKGEQEGFGMVIVEAMLSGIPVIASASGGIPDIIENGVSGILVPERDAEAIASSVERIAGDRSVRESLALAGRRRALDQFHPDSIAIRFEGVYLSAAAPAG